MAYDKLKKSDILKQLKERIQDLDINFRPIIQEYLNEQLEQIEEQLLEKNQTKDFENIEEIREDIFELSCDLAMEVEQIIAEL